MGCWLRRDRLHSNAWHKVLRCLPIADASAATPLLSDPACGARPPSGYSPRSGRGEAHSAAKRASSEQSSGRHDCAMARVNPPRSTSRPCESGRGTGTPCSLSVPATSASPLHGAASRATDVRSHSEHAASGCASLQAASSRTRSSSLQLAAACAHRVVTSSAVGGRNLRDATPSTWTARAKLVKPWRSSKSHCDRVLFHTFFCQMVPNWIGHRRRSLTAAKLPLLAWLRKRYTYSHFAAPDRPAE